MRTYTPIILLASLVFLASSSMSAEVTSVLLNPAPSHLSPSLSSLDAQPDTILYDSGPGNGLRLRISEGYWCGVRFTPSAPFELHEAYIFMVDGPHSDAPCSLFVYGPEGPAAGEALAFTLMHAPFPDQDWYQVSLDEQLELPAEADFFLIMGPVPGGEWQTTGFKPVMDSETTENRSAIADSGGQFGVYADAHGDFMIRAGGAYGSFVDLAALNSYNEGSDGEPRFFFEPGETLKLHARVKNRGNSTALSCNVNLSLLNPAGTEILSESVQLTDVHAADTVAVTTPSGVMLTDTGEYRMLCTLQAPLDYFAENNQAILKFFVGDNPRWYRYCDNDDPELYTLVNLSRGVGVSFIPAVYPAKITKLRVNLGEPASPILRIYLNDTPREINGEFVWFDQRELSAGWNEIPVDPPVNLYEDETFTVTLLANNSVVVGYDTDPPNCAANPDMPNMSWKSPNVGTIWYIDSAAPGNLCLQAYLDSSSALPPWPFIEMGVAAFNFGTVVMREASTQTFWIHNHGYEEELVIEAIGVEPPELRASCIISPDTIIVASQDSVEVSVTFAPLDSHYYEGTLTFPNNSANLPLPEITIQGVGVPCETNRVLVDASGGYPVCHCVDACETELTTICFAPLAKEDRPGSAFTVDACLAYDGGTNHCTLPAAGAVPSILRYLYYDEEAEGWCVLVAADSAGGFCVCVDNIRSAELARFVVYPGDSELRLEWQTSAETENDHFEIVREGALSRIVAAENLPDGSLYNWTDVNVENGVNYHYELYAVNLFGDRWLLGTGSGTPSDNSVVISDYALHQNYPNPFNPQTTITFDLPRFTFVSLRVYNLLGNEVATLTHGLLTSGRHSVYFVADGLSSGIYLYRLEAGSYTETRKLVVLK